MPNKVQDYYASRAQNSSCSPGFVVGIDLGGTKVAGILLSPDGVILARERKDVAANVDRAALVEILAELVNRLSIAGSGGVEAVGIGVPGPLEEDGRVLPPVPNLPKVGRLPLCELLQDAVNCPVVLENDANCFALGESVFGRGKGCEIVVGITLGTGLGVGIVMGGKIHQGSHWSAGDIWDLPLEGGHILEDYLCGRYLVQQTGAATAQEVADRARAGERSAVEAWHSLGQRLAWLLGMLGRVVDPDLFVLGGSLSRGWELFASDIQQISSRWPVRLSSDPEGMTMRGAGSMAAAVSIEPKSLNHR